MRRKRKGNVVLGNYRIIIIYIYKVRDNAIYKGAIAWGLKIAERGHCMFGC